MRADARHIPLRDQSVQCVISSPPYWSLRDYGTGTWDGGDADCDHVKTLNLKRDCSGGVSGRDYGTRGEQPSSSSSVIQFADHCGKCGARRIDRQIGLEPTPDCLGWATKSPCGECYVCTMVGVFREVKRVLRADGCVFLNMGDSFASGEVGRHDHKVGKRADGAICVLKEFGQPRQHIRLNTSLKPKDLCGMPWRVAFALQADGWFLRSDIIWAKPNPMPESVTDRCTRSHEYIFLLSKRPTYYYDAESIREPLAEPLHSPGNRPRPPNPADASNGHHWSVERMNKTWGNSAGRNKRDVWTINSEAFPDSHFATFPQKLIEPCILAGTSEKGCCAQCGAPRVRVSEHTLATVKSPASDYGNGAGRHDGGRSHLVGASNSTLGWRPSCAHDAPSVPCIVLDPFGGSGTVLKVCNRLGRRSVLLELSAEYIEIARQRTAQAGFFFGEGARA